LVFQWTTVQLDCATIEQQKERAMTRAFILKALGEKVCEAAQAACAAFTS